MQRIYLHGKLHGATTEKAKSKLSLCVINHQAMKTYGGVERYLHAFLLRHKMEVWSASRLGHFYPPVKEPMILSGSEAGRVPGAVEKISLTSAENRTPIPRQSNPYPGHYTEWEDKHTDLKSLTLCSLRSQGYGRIIWKCLSLSLGFAIRNTLPLPDRNHTVARLACYPNTGTRSASETSCFF
jgi:hypothetical protein